MFDRVRFYFNL
jgi:Ca2+-binding EF-hand superfamily protein